MSPPSFRSVNYAIRPAKSIERKFITEIAQRLGRAYDTTQLRYVGLGSTYFTDFVMIHRVLGSQSMVSVEREGGQKDRFLFNKPYHCIEMVFGESSSVLPTLKLSSRPAVVWLDYDDALAPYMLGDIGTLCFDLPSISLFVLSVNVDPRAYGASPSERFAYFTAGFPDRVDMSVYGPDLKQSQISELVYQILAGSIGEAVGQRNAGPEPNRVTYQQLMHCRYRDSTPMLTVGGALYSRLHRPGFLACDFGSIEHVRTDGSAYEISVPSLTLRERQALDQCLPGGSPDVPGVPASDVEKYRALYRYFPDFAEVEL